MLRPKRLAVLACAVLAACWYCGARVETRAAQTDSFSGVQAFNNLKRLAAFGPRPAGSKALEESRRWIESQLRQDGLKVDEDSFTASTPIGPIPMVNLIVKIPGASPRVIMLAGHYDTAPFHDFKFVGANDGASSAAFLLEMGRVLAHQKNASTIWLVFFDGEEAQKNWTNADSLYGSRHLAQELTDDGELGRIRAMILVDMIADAKPKIYRDGNSTSWLNDLLFSTADRLGYGKEFLNQELAYGDDHIPFVNAGVSAVDLLGNVGPITSPGSFGIYWHTAQDTPDKCSPASLAIVGRVVLASLPQIEKSHQ